MGIYSGFEVSVIRRYKNIAENAITDIGNYKLDAPSDNLKNIDILNSEISKKCCDSLNNISSSKNLVGSINSLKFNLKKLVDILEIVEEIQDLDDDSKKEEKKKEREIKKIYDRKNGIF